MKRSRIYLYLFLLNFLSLYIQKFSIIGVKIYDIMSIITFAIILLVDNAKFLMCRDIVALLFFYFSFFQVFMLPLSVDYSLSILEVARFFFSVLLFINIYHLTSFIKEIELIRILYKAIISLSLFTIIVYRMEEMAILPPITYSGPVYLNRREAFMLDPNYFSFWILSILVLFIVWYKYKFVTFRALLLLYILTGYLTLMTLSRTGYLFFFIVSLYFFSILPVKKNLKFVLFFTLIILIYLVFKYHEKVYFLHAILEREIMESKDGEIRILIWKGGLQAFYNNIFGYGPGVFREVASKFSGIYADAHNTFIWILVNNGVLAEIFYVFFVIYILKKLGVKYSVLWFGIGLYLNLLTFDTFRYFYFLLALIFGVEDGNRRYSTNNIK